MGLLDFLMRVFDPKAAAKRAREHAAAQEAVQRAPGGGVPPPSQRAPEPEQGPAQKASAATGVGTGDPAPEAVRQTDPAVQSASADETPDEQRQAAAEDPAATSTPGSEGQDQEPR